MNPKKKKSLLKKAKRCDIIAWVAILLFILTFVFVGFSHKMFGKPLAEVIPVIPFVIFISSLPFIGLGATFIMQGYIGERRLYYKKICQYRTRKFFHEIMKLVQEGNLKKAVQIFNACNFKSEPLLEDYLVGMLINELQHSNDNELQELGRKKLTTLLNRFNPDTIIFN